LAGEGVVEVQHGFCMGDSGLGL
jgi:hypothetical protein